MSQFKVCGTCMAVIEGGVVFLDEHMTQRAQFMALHPFLLLADVFDLGELDAACECCTAPPGFRYLVEQL